MNKKLLRKKLALMLANLKKKRKYYTEIEYLENTGTGANRNWINTGIVPNTNTKWEVRVAFNNTSTGKLMGSGFATPTRFNLGIESNKFRFAFNAWFDANQSIITPDTNAHTWIMDATSKTFTIDEYSTTPTYTFGTSTYPICLFCRSNSASGNTETNNNSLCKIYYTKIWDNGVLVRDMIPVLDWDYVPCMYDKISRELFYNQGTGSFSYGREIHYVDYLESTGTQYILTGFTPTLNTDFELELSSTSTGMNNWAMGAPVWIGVHYKGTTNQVGVTNSSTSAFQQYTPYNHDNSRITMKLSGDTVYANGVSLGTITRRAGNLDFALFGYRDANQGATLLFSGNIYKCKILDNGVPVRDYIPAISEDGTPFMFDRVTHTIYDNAGQGSFNYPPVELEYLESSGTQYIDTGIYGTPDLKTTITFQELEINAQSSGKAIFGCYNSNNANNYYLYQRGTVGVPPFEWQAGFGNFANTPVKVDTDKHTAVFDNYKLYLDGVEIQAFTSGTLTQTPQTLLLFNMHNASGGTYDSLKKRIFSCQMVLDSAPFRNFIPVFYNGSAGMWDKVNSVFYPNAGTGTFTAGAVKEPEYE